MDRSAVILAGGQGRRMGGRNKALLTLGPDTFIERQLRACLAWTDDVVVAGGGPDFTEGLRERFGGKLRFAADRYPQEGPLAGLHAGLTAAVGDAAWVLACDQPLAHAGAAALLLERLRQDGVQAAMLRLGGRLQPLHAVYDRAAAAAAAAALLGCGERRLTALLDRLSWVALDEAAFERLGVPADFADDVDTPEDYERMLRLAADGFDRRSTES